MTRAAIGASLAAALLAAGCASPKPAEGKKTWSEMRSEDRQKKLVALPGMDTRVLRYGNGQIEFVASVAPRPDSGAARTAVVYVHGIGGTLGDFAPEILDGLPDRDVVAVNLPGTGRSTDVRERYTIRSFAEVLDDVLTRRMELKRFDLVCHSLGGQVCIAYALDHPAAVATLTLIDAAGSYDQGEFIKRMAKKYARINMGEVYVPDHPAITIFTGGDQAIVSRIMAGDATLLSGLSSFNANYRDRVRDLDVPVLIIWGENDPVFPLQSGFFLLGNLRDARLRVVPGAGHVPQLTDPALVEGWIREFIGAHSAPLPKETP